ncbi:MAG TPA: OsmC family protein [Polyangiaceae bacterium]|jgi:putative redox protein|nr:OsmC family protein [Polyangiaceae bacterium]
MIDIDVIYEGELHCSAVHRPSGAKLATDAPVDNQGRGESFSPTDLVATALGTCMATVMGITARRQELPIAGARLNVKKAMTTVPPRRIATLAVRIDMPDSAKSIGPDARKGLEHAANTCPVRLSLLDAIDVPVEFVWP